MHLPSKTFGFFVLAFGLMAAGISMYCLWKIKYATPRDGFHLHILDRSEWRGEPPQTKDAKRLETPVKSVIICHTATEGCENEELCTYRMRIIQKFHMESLGWIDIAYNFLVGGDGQVYVGRGWDTQAQHVKGYGSSTLSIAFIGTFTTQTPNIRQQVAAKKLMAEGVRLHKLHADFHIYGARQFSPTESPGRQLYELIQSWPRWSRDTQHLTHNNNETLRIVPRDFWLAQPPQISLEELKLPANSVQLLTTDTDECTLQADCTFRVRFLQTLNMESLKQADIIYNFLIGGDGNAYVGRGWSTISATENATKDSISLAYIGTFKNTLPTERQKQTTNLLLSEGVRLGKLINDFKIVGNPKLWSKGAS